MGNFKKNRLKNAHDLAILNEGGRFILNRFLNELLKYGPETVNVHFSVRSALEDEIQIQVQVINQDKYPSLMLKENKQSSGSTWVLQTN